MNPSDASAPCASRACQDAPPPRNRYLLVDDEVDFVTTLAERLELRNVGEVAVVHSGAAALEAIALSPPRVVVLDLRMPGMHGMDVLRQIKQQYPGVAVIIHTGHGAEEDRLKAMELGAYAYLQKPVDIGELTALLDQAGRGDDT